MSQYDIYEYLKNNPNNKYSTKQLSIILKKSRNSVQVGTRKLNEKNMIKYIINKLDHGTEYLYYYEK